MTQSRLIVIILVLLSFLAYCHYTCCATMIRIGNDKDTINDRAYNPLMATQQFHSSQNYFNWKTDHGNDERTVSSKRNKIGTHICDTRNRMFLSGSITIAARQDMPPVIVPPLPTTGCESLVGNARTLCEVDFEKIITVAACLGAGLVIVPALFFIAWTLGKWIRAVRPKKKTIMIGKEAKRKARLTASGLWGKGSGRILGLSPGREADIDEGNAVGARTRRARARLEEKEVWYGGVRMTMPWGRGRNWDRAVAQLPSKGTTRGMLVGLSPNSSSIYILEPGQFDISNRAAERCPLAISENTRDVGIRVVSTGREVSTERGILSQRTPSGLGSAPDLERR